MILTGVRALEGEEWRPVVGWEEKYLVSNLGRVYSIPRFKVHGGLLAGCINADGYRVVNLIRPDRTRMTARVHRLVAFAFHGAPEPGQEVRHLNGERADNRTTNLAWGTRSENNFDQVLHGTHAAANKTHCKNGHPFSEANTRITYRGDRQCVTCRRASLQRYALKRQQVAS